MPTNPSKKCPGCQKKLFKTVSANHRAVADVTYCRNPKCERYADPDMYQDMLIKRRSRLEVSVVERMAEQLEQAEDAHALAAIEKLAEQVADEPELPSLAKARERIRDLLAKATPEHTSRATVGIILALVSQETGNYTAADALIKEYSLDTLFGMKLHSEKKQ